MRTNATGFCHILVASGGDAMRKGYTVDVRSSGGGDVGCVGAIALFSSAMLMTLWFAYLMGGAM
jgi:hypothetical protein